MISGQVRQTTLPPAITRLSALAPLDEGDLGALQAAMREPHQFRARRDILKQGQPAPGPSLIVSGWACRTHNLLDGRRQIISLILPGDVINAGRHRSPLAASGVMALTDVAMCAAPVPQDPSRGTGLAEAYEVSRAWDEAYLLRTITRLGRLSAYERIADLFLEIHERLALAGLTQGNAFALPLTQELLGDATGLTTVHVNRTIQSLRQDEVLTVTSGRVVLDNPVKLAELVHRGRTAVQAS